MTAEPSPHRWAIAEREYARHEARRGRRHAYETLDPARTALLVVDLVDFFVMDNPYARGIIGNVNRLAATTRDSGGTVCWVLPGEEQPAPARVEFLGPVVSDLYRHAGGSGPPGARLWQRLRPASDDLFVEKSSASAFFPGRSPLPGLLSDRGIDTVVVTGAVTDVCVESTVRDAATLGYRVVLVADGCATITDEAHNATLRTVYRSFGDVRATDEVVALLSAGSGDPLAD